MTTPGAWTPDQSELATQAATVAQSQQFLQQNPLQPPAPGCDWTAATWTDPTTYCTLNWVMVGMAAAGVVAAVSYAGKRRR